MPEERNGDRRSDWAEYQRLVISELDRLEKGQREVMESINTYKDRVEKRIGDLKLELGLMKQRLIFTAIILSLIAGATPDLISLVIRKLGAMSLGIGG